MVRVAGVRFKSAGKVYYFDPDEFEVEVNDQVIEQPEVWSLVQLHLELQR